MVCGYNWNIMIISKDSIKPPMAMNKIIFFFLISNLRDTIDLILEIIESFGSLKMSIPMPFFFRNDT